MREAVGWRPTLAPLASIATEASVVVVVVAASEISPSDLIDISVVVAEGESEV